VQRATRLTARWQAPPARRQRDAEVDTVDTLSASSNIAGAADLCGLRRETRHLRSRAQKKARPRHTKAAHLARPGGDRTENSATHRAGRGWGMAGRMAGFGGVGKWGDIGHSRSLKEAC